MADSKEKLFSDFPSVSTQEWMDKINFSMHDRIHIVLDVLRV